MEPASSIAVASWQYLLCAVHRDVPLHNDLSELYHVSLSDGIPIFHFQVFLSLTVQQAVSNSCLIDFFMHNRPTTDMICVIVIKSYAGFSGLADKVRVPPGVDTEGMCIPA